MYRGVHLLSAVRSRSFRSGMAVRLAVNFECCQRSSFKYSPGIRSTHVLVMSRSPRRLSFPSSSQDFALPSSSTPVTSPEDPSSPLFLRFRRTSLLPRPSSAYADKHTSSPLAVSFTIPTRRHRSTGGEESESDRERMCTESSPSNSSGNPTPPIYLPASKDTERIGDQSSRDTLNPSTPPNQNISVLAPAPRYSPVASNSRRQTYPLKPARILNLLAESTRPEDDEVKSEAAFQRLIASYSELPAQPRTPRAPSNKGRYPEEAVEEDFPREDTPSDEDDVDAIFAFDPPSEPATTKPCTPAHSVNGDDPATYTSESPMVVAMDVDPPLTSPLVTSTPSSFDDRYDPYPTAAKRRAVSPSMSYLREVHPSLSYPRTPNGRPSFPNPLAIPVSNSGSTSSSPTVTSYSMPIYTSSRQVGLGSTSVSSSPILRPTLGLASPILRPLARNRRGTDADERDIEGANEGVNGLTLS
ncbi:hypothetical protein EDC04DRAFT_2619972 [Pisolithus marmoratus]|nr:hypothetical protein EDC04DRAFT_2619972 [Pisolithus marmoratus]